MSKKAKPKDNVLILPPKLRLFGKDFTVDTFAQTDFTRDIIGRVDCTVQAIHLREGLAVQQATETLLHECIHVISDYFSLDLEENQVQALGAGLYAVLHDNPELTKAFL